MPLDSLVLLCQATHGGQDIITKPESRSGCAGKPHGPASRIDFFGKKLKTLPQVAHTMIPCYSDLNMYFVLCKNI